MLIGIGLTFQVAAVVFIFYRLRGKWFTHIGAVFVVLAVAYHGVNEILLWAFPGHAVYRSLVSAQFVGQFVFWIGLAIFLFTAAYLAALRRSSPKSPSGDKDDERIQTALFFDWRLMILATLPFIVLTLAGHGYGRGTLTPALAASPQSLTQGLTQQFLLTMIVLVGFGIVGRFGRTWVLPVLLVQSLLAAALGERLEILVAAGLLIYALARVGIRIPRYQLISGAATFLLVALMLTSARAAEGRFSTTAGGTLRLDHLIGGIRNITSASTRDLLVYDLGYRLDGNTFGALELQAESRGSPSLGLRPLADDLWLAIPSLLEPHKKSSPLEVRSEKVYAENHLGIRLPEVAPGVAGDILPTQLGALMGFWGPWGLLIAAIGLGALFGSIDRWLLSRVSPTRLLIGLGLLSCVLFYERSWDVYPLTFRGIIILLTIGWALQGWRARRALRTPVAQQADRLAGTQKSFRTKVNRHA